VLQLASYAESAVRLLVLLLLLLLLLRQGLQMRLRLRQLLLPCSLRHLA
jgi:hypothetical protein